MRNHLSFLALLFVTALTVGACGGGGGGAGNQVTNPGAGAGTDPANGVNPGAGADPGAGANPGAGAGPSPTPATPIVNLNVSGKLYYEAPGNYIELDLATGVETLLRKNGLGMNVSLDGTEMVMTNRFVSLLSVGDFREELVIFDRQGTAITRFFRTEGFSGTPHLSPDKTKIISEWSNTNVGDPVNVAIGTVFSRSGAVLKRYSGYSAYAFFTDGRILMSKGDSLYIASAALGEPVFLKSFVGDRPRGIRISPDGSKIALTLYGPGIDPTSAVNYPHVWMMNVDGSNLRQLTTSNSNDDVGDFSPDSKSLIVSQGISYASIGPGYVFTGCPEAYVIPLNAAAIINLTADNPAPAQKLRSRSDNGTATEKLCTFSRPTWRNNTALASTAGGAANGAGLNKGLLGTLWYRFAGDIFKTIVQTGATTMLPKNQGADLAVSLDGQEISFYDRFRPTNPSNEAIVITNTQGNQLAGFELISSFSGTPKLSPDKSKIAIEWHSIDRGDAGGTDVVTIFSRTGTILQRFKDFNSWAWLPDGRLILASYDEIYVTSAAGSASTTLIKTLPDYVSGLVVSPDGKRVAFSMHQNTWLMNIDGTGLKKMNASERPYYAGDFSPDGKFLLLQPNESSYDAWAVPVDGERVPVGYGSDVATSAYRLLDDAGKNVYPSGRVSWRN
jgi:hypothetical protein